MLNKISIIVLLFITIISCKSDHKSLDLVENSKPRKITHFNIKIVSDLSNRLDNSLYPRQLSDQEIIDEILEVYPTLFDSYNRISLQKDKISYGLINPLEINNFNALKEDLTIDLGKFEFNQNKRIEFIMNRGKSNENLDFEIELFKQAIDTIYHEAINRKDYYTADTRGFFNQIIDEDYFSLTNPISSPKAKDVSRNVVILLTDGFVEIANRNSYSSCPEKECDLLNNYQIEKFRNYYNNLKVKVSLKEAFLNSGFSLKPVNNPNLKNIEFLFLEINGRSKSISGRITKTPSDYEILKLFWEDFMEKEGVEKYAIKNVQTSTDDISLIVKKFLKASDKNESI